MVQKRYKQTRPWRIPGFMQFFLFLMIACAIWIALNIGAAPEYLSAYVRRNQVRSEVEKLEERISDLERDQSQLKGNGFQDEAAAREKYRLVRPGEKIVFLEYE